jgi:hypothetical protein
MNDSPEVLFEIFMLKTLGRPAEELERIEHEDGTTSYLHQNVAVLNIVWMHGFREGYKQGD